MGTIGHTQSTSFPQIHTLESPQGHSGIWHLVTGGLCLPPTLKALNVLEDANLLFRELKNISSKWYQMLEMLCYLPSLLRTQAVQKQFH